MLNYGDYDLKPPGGRFPGRPKGTDVQPAWLTPGEFVVPAGPAAANKGLLEAIRNSSGPLKQLPGMHQVGIGGEGFDDGVQYLASGGTAGRRKNLLRRRRKARKAREARAASRQERQNRQQALVDEKAKRQKEKFKKEREGAWEESYSEGFKFEGGAMRKAGKERQGRVFEAAGSFLGGMTNKSELRGGGEFLEGAGKLGGMVPVVGPAIEGITKFGKVLLESIDKLKDWTNKLHDANMRFSEFSGAMAAVAARQEIRDIQMDIRRGEQQAASAEYLAGGKSALREKFTDPAETLVANIRNIGGGMLSHAGAWLSENLGVKKVLDELNGGLKDISQALNGQKPQDVWNAQKELQAVIDDAMNEQVPPNFGPRDTTYSGIGGDF